MVSAMDDGIGTVLQKLKEKGLEENTMVVFLSDNGGPTNDNGSNNRPLRGQKSNFWDGGIKVPFAIQWPAKIKAKPGFNEGVGHIIDLLPTSLELAGVPINNLPGQSLSYLWNGKAMQPETYFWEHVGNKAMRKGNWKIVKDVEDAAWELYDMSMDMTESNNLAKTNTALLNQMIAEYELWTKQNGVKVFVKGKNKAD